MMDWPKLKIGRCPNCSDSLKNTGTILTPMYSCVSKACEFKISGDKFDEIVNDRYKPRVFKMPEKDNFGELQQMGHVGMTEDFSDSYPKV
jgi:hypothetical protein